MAKRPVKKSTSSRSRAKRKTPARARKKATQARVAIGREPSGIKLSGDFVNAKNALRKQMEKSLPKSIGLSATTSDMPGNVLGYGVGLKSSLGKFTDQVAIKVYVTTKRASRAVARGQEIPAEIDGIPTDVEEIGMVSAWPHSDVTASESASAAAASEGNHRLTRPVQCGCGIAHQNLPGFGTLGAVVEAQVDGELIVCLLSNNHVIANADMGSIEDRIVQPGRGPVGTDAIGILKRIVPLQNGLVDAALAWTSWSHVDPAYPDFKLYGGEENPPRKFLDPQVKMVVKKYGARTGYQLGIVTDINVDIDVNYGPRGNIHFRDQFKINGALGLFGDQGDSGSLVIEDSTYTPVGLYFADGDGPEISNSFANKISNVVQALNIERFVAVAPSS